MSRRRQAEKRNIEPDLLYNSKTIAKFINRVMLGGKKDLARTIVYRALERFAKKVGQESPLEAFEQALENAKPSLEVKSRRIGGATFQVPVEIPQERRETLAMRWMINFSRKRPGKNMEESLALELTGCYNNEGTTIKKKDDTHRMAEANRAFASFK